MIPGEDSETRTPDLLVEGTVEEAEKDVVAAATEEEVSPTMIDALEPEQEKEKEDVSLSFLCYRDWLEGQIHDLSPAAATEFYLAEQVRLQEHQQDADVVFDDRYWTYLDDKIKQTSAAAQVLRAAFGDDDPPDDYDPSRYRNDNDDTPFSSEGSGQNGVPSMDGIGATPFSLSPSGRSREGTEGGDDTSSLAYYKEWVEQAVNDLGTRQEEILAFYVSERDRLQHQEDCGEVDDRYKIYIEGLIANCSRDCDCEPPTMVDGVPTLVSKEMEEKAMKMSLASRLCRALQLLCCPFGKVHRERSVQKQASKWSPKSEFRSNGK